MGNTLNSYLRGALQAQQMIAQFEQILGQRQQRQLAQSQEQRATSQAGLNEAATRTEILGRTEAGGQLEVPGMGAVNIPGLTGRGELEARIAGQKAKATTAGQLEAQEDAFGRISKQSIIDAKEKLKAAGIKEDTPEYNSQLARLLGIQEEIEIDLGGQKFKLTAKDAASLKERQLDSQGDNARAKEIAHIQGSYRLQAAQMGIEAANKRAERLPASVKTAVAKLNTAESVLNSIAGKFKPEYVSRWTADPKAAVKREGRVLLGQLDKNEADFRNLVLKEMNEAINDLGGANVPAAELARLKESLANVDKMTPVEFKSAINNAASRIRRLRNNMIKEAETGELQDIDLFGSEDDIPEFDPLTGKPVRKP